VKQLAAVLLLVTLDAWFGHAQEPRPLLLQKPTVNRTHVVFVYGDDLWIVGREGGDARRLTTGLHATDPAFSPDGTQLAFTGEAQGNQDVYVMPAAGGPARRLTYHPGGDRAVGWTPDGKHVLFRSFRESHDSFPRLFTVAVEGGLPRALPLPKGYQGSYSPDGKHIAYVPLSPAFETWKRYRGGRATAVWLADLSDSHVEKVPRTDSNDFNPMWLGKRVFFLSDRNGPFTLFVYDPATRKVAQVLANDGLDVKSASAGPDAIVYEQFGSLHLLDPKSGTHRRLEVRVPSDLPDLRPRFEKVAGQIRNADISPSGARAVFEAHGEILTVPAAKGDVRNLTNTPGVAERDPAWSPDGRSVAWFSDESGEYQLHVSPAQGGSPVKKFALGRSPSFYSNPTWSPDGKKIAYNDKRLGLWLLDLTTGKNTLVDTGTWMDDIPVPSWSPDGRWLAYAKQLRSGYQAIFVYSRESGDRHRLTDGMSDAQDPVFDKGGRYLYFTASTDVGQALEGLALDMAVIGRPVTRSVYAILLRNDLPSPLAPESDEEKGAADKPGKAAGADKGKADAEPVRIDLEEIDLRILPLPLPPRNYRELRAGKPGVVFALEGQPARIEVDPGRWKNVLHRFDLDKRKAEKFIEDVAAFRVSHDGEKLLYRQGERWFIVPAGQPPKAGEGALALNGLEVRVEPQAEWRQMYREVWRIERDYLYDPGAHGLDLRAAQKRYARYLDGVASRRDLDYLFREMLGELTLGHVYINGPPNPDARVVKVGLLGADYQVENGRYRIARVYRGENWNPQLRAPLVQPGARVKTGEYLLAVNGHELRPPDNLYRHFECTAGKAVELRVGPNADGTGARTVTVVPVESERELRHLAWVNDNRRKVDELSGGRAAYIYLPDCYLGGYTRFTREFFAQAGKEAAVIDERCNHGGIMPHYVIDMLGKRPRSWTTTREGEDQVHPHGAIFGPKVMLIDEMAGSGGDILPYYFRQAGLGPLVGKRTWGGAVGIGGYPRLLDGGSVTAPKVAHWFPSGKWELENHGVEPDVEVELDPQAVRAGHDPQLEKAVSVVLEELKKHPPTRPPRPAYPNYHKAGKAEVGGSGPGR
jgi:tricorn protease